MATPSITTSATRTQANQRTRTEGVRSALVRALTEEHRGHKRAQRAGACSYRIIGLRVLIATTVGLSARARADRILGSALPRVSQPGSGRFIDTGRRGGPISFLLFEEVHHRLELVRRISFLKDGISAVRLTRSGRSPVAVGVGRCGGDPSGPGRRCRCCRSCGTPFAAGFRHRRGALRTTAKAAGPFLDDGGRRRRLRSRQVCLRSSPCK